jgi:hypothetical protein
VSGGLGFIAIMKATGIANFKRRVPHHPGGFPVAVGPTKIAAADGLGLPRVGYLLVLVMMFVIGVGIGAWRTRRSASGPPTSTWW